MNISLFTWIDRRLGMEKSENRVRKVKQDAVDQMEEVASVLDKAGRLQKIVMKKTTTFYIAKAAGIIK